MKSLSEDVQFLLRSEIRIELLSVLDRTGAIAQRALRDELTASERTVRRTLTELEDRRLVTDAAEGYRLTALGETQIEAYREWRDRTELAASLRPLLGHLEPGVLGFDIERLQDASLTVADETRPYAVLDRTLQLRAEANRIRELAPAVEKRSVEQLATRVDRGESPDVEVILPAATARRARSEPAYEDAVATITAAEAVTRYVYPGSVPMFLGLIDELAVLGSIADGSPRALVETTDATVYEWVEHRLDEYRVEARPLSGSI